jgi:ATP-binding cassette subfamily B protein
VAGANLLALYPGWATGHIIDALVAAPNASSYAEVFLPVAKYLAGVGVFSLLRALLMVGMRLTLVVLSRRVERDQRSFLLQKLLEWDLSTFQKHSTGELLTYFTEDLNRLRNLTGPVVLYGLQTLFLGVFTAVLMFYTDPWLATVSLAPVALIPPLTYFLRQKAVRRGLRQQEAFARLSAFLQQVYPFLRPLKAVAQPPALMKRWQTLTETHAQASLAVARIEAYLHPLTMLLVGLSLTGVLIYGGIRAATGAISLGVIGSFSLYLLQLMFPLGAVGWLMSLIQQAKASAERLLNLQALTPALHYPPVSLSCPKAPQWRWENLAFRYGPEASWIFERFSGTIQTGEKIALSLPMGTGKTTLARLLVRQVDPVSGEIFFGDVPLRTLSREDLRRWIGYVPQQPILLSGSIADNLRLVRPEASRHELWQALEWAGLADEVAALPQGLRTDIGLWGQQISGGQRQRLALAMVLLKQPQALILDETFAPLDSEKIHEILTHLKKYFSSATWLLLTHRQEVKPFVDVWAESLQEAFSSKEREIGARCK